MTNTRPRFNPLSLVLLAAILLLPVGCRSTASTMDASKTTPTPGRMVTPTAGHVGVVTGNAGVVVCESKYAAQVGAEVLRDGGNAVDAAVATAFTLAVVWPEAGNIAGGGFMMVAAPDHEDVWCVDYREKAPAGATADLFADGTGTRFDHTQVGVPGTVAGLAMAHEKWGKLPWNRLVMPAAKLAGDGFEIDAFLAESINDLLASETVPAELRRDFGKPGGGMWQAGDTLVLPDLAGTLRKIADGGAASFYDGAIAGAIADDMAANGGLITRQDLLDYEAVPRKAIHASYNGYDVFGPPPPSGGGITLAMMLHQLDALPLTEHDRFSPEALHLMAEAMRRGYHQRALYLGDTDFVEVPMQMVRPAYGAKLAETIDPEHATPSDELAPAIPLAAESPDTTHISVIDADGLAVSNTYTLEMSWGSRVMVPGTGVLLNNEMGDFNPVPGETTRGGRIGTDANLIAPGKRMLSSMTPTIVKRDGKVVLLTGSPGGRTITNTVLNIVVSVCGYDMPLADAVEHGRIHHQWFPDELRVEEGDPALDAAVDGLRRMGHTVVRRSSQGSAHSIAIDPDTGKRTGVADFRRGGAAVAQ